MRRAVLVTCRRWPALSTSDALYASALEARGLSVQAAPWNGPAEPFHGVDIIVLRSNWDYHHAPAAFIAWIEKIAASEALLLNQPRLVLWNLDKRYLLDLAEHGVATPTTHVVENDPTAVSAVMDRYGWDAAVVKPAVGASGHDVRLVTGDVRSRAGALPEAPRLLVQEYLPEVRSEGELSCVYFEGVHSHAFTRRPRAGEFRVNSQYAGTIERARPPAAAVTAAETVLHRLPELPLYARVDGVMRDGAFVLMELELNEPGLCLDLDPAAAGRFAAATVGRLDAGSSR